jgi:hypothetical protein
VTGTRPPQGLRRHGVACFVAALVRGPHRIERSVSHSTPQRSPRHFCQRLPATFRRKIRFRERATAPLPSRLGMKSCGIDKCYRATRVSKWLDRLSSVVTVARLFCVSVAFSAFAFAGVISGTVVEASNNDPVRKAIVTLTLQGTPLEWATTRTDSSGAFRFETLPVGTYDLRAAKEEVGAAIYGAASLHQPGDPIKLDDGETRAGVTLRFVRSAAISGRVLDSAGDPASGMIVTLLIPTHNPGGRVLTRYRRAEADDHGDYRIDGVAPGQYYLHASPPPPEGDRLRGARARTGAARDRESRPQFNRATRQLMLIRVVSASHNRLGSALLRRLSKVVIRYAAQNQTVDGVFVLLRIVPAVTLVWCRQPAHCQRLSLTSS